MELGSNNEEKSLYRQVREALGYSREKASEILETITPERLERIESGKYDARPDEIITMAKKYQEPSLCNYYCSNICEIGKQYVPEVKINKELSQIVLEMLANLQSIQEKQKRLVEITADGIIDNKELEDFNSIQEELKKITVTITTLRLWAERKNI